MTIIIAFHMSNHRDFKNYYIGFIAKFYLGHFPAVLSYTRILEVTSKAIIPLSSYFTTLKGEPTGIGFIDSTSIKVCHIYACRDIKPLVVLQNEVNEDGLVLRG